jgi:spore germination cell wall hydrolase CwlJ-like protein
VSKRNIVLPKFRLSIGDVLAPAIFGLAGFLLLPGNAAEADINSMIAGQTRNADGWRNFMVTSAAGSLHQAEMVFAEDEITGSIKNGAGVVLSDGRRLAFRGPEKPAEDSEDEDRVTRKLKKGRVVAVERIQPPKDFAAGSILERTSNLLRPFLDENKKTAFVRPKILGKEIAIALAFHEKKPERRDIGVPLMLASLVTNDTADVLATAYADPEPDYARVSPFDAILNPSDKRGRFIPQIGRQDHAWAATPLPASVFGKREQQCLAEAIYFEAATEPLKGQAAVAQVVLNRVRNPTYPATICGVVYQNETWRNRCQFSFACDNIKDRIWSKSHWKTAREIALAVTAGKIWLKEVGSSTHYHAVYVHPDWAPTMKKVGRIGLHIFYRTYGGGWS